MIYLSRLKLPSIKQELKYNPGATSENILDKALEIDLS